jgi:hypothetical protein
MHSLNTGNILRCPELSDSLRFMNITKQHVGAAGLSVGGILGLVIEGINWANTHLVAANGSVCANGLSSGVVTTVAVGLGLVTSAGVVLAMFAPSVSDKVNQQAGFEANRRLSTVPPAPTSTEIK